MSNKAYKFYESDEVLQEILDELVKDRQLTPTIHNLLLNGLGKDIKKTKKSLKQRIATINKVDKLYKRVQTQRDAKKEAIYDRYKRYRDELVKNEVLYSHENGLEWIKEKAEKLNISAEDLLTELEERYKAEK